jgi:hypothetical protein
MLRRNIEIAKAQVGRPTRIVAVQNAPHQTGSHGKTVRE